VRDGTLNQMVKGPSIYHLCHTILVQKLVFGYSKNVESDLAPEKDAHCPKLDETLIAMPQQQLLLPSRAQQSIQNAHY